MIVDKKERQMVIDNKNNTLSLCVKTLQEEKIFEIPMDSIKQITYVVNLEEEQPGRWLAVKKELVTVPNKGICFVDTQTFETLLSKVKVVA